MRTIAILMLMGISMAAETPKQPPDAKPEPVKTAALDSDKLEILELKMALADKSEAEARRTKADIQAAYAAMLTTACNSIGGKTSGDCEPMPRQQGQPLSIRLKPVTAKAVK